MLAVAAQDDTPKSGGSKSEPPKPQPLRGAQAPSKAGAKARREWE
jgi:hypothetical protein